jgi:hypothetical protein
MSVFKPANSAFLSRVVLKAAMLFILLNLVFAVTDPIPLIGKLSIYNWLVPGRERLPYGERPEAYNLSLYSIEAMFASHRINQAKPADEFRVVIVGDSSVWGVLLENEQTLAAHLNRAGLMVQGKSVRFYNLGYPTMSVLKDLLILEEATNYQLDMVIWLVTLESLPIKLQIDSPLVRNNASRIRSLIERFDLNLDEGDSRFSDLSFWDRTLIGQRRVLADWWRLQLYGVSWSATGVDQIIGEFALRANDLSSDVLYQGIDPQELTVSLSLNVLVAGGSIVGQVPLIVVNEPVFIADGSNSDVRYNVWYPRWAYDAYRDWMHLVTTRSSLLYIDLWNRVPMQEFTDSPVHLTPLGSEILATELIQSSSFLINGGA